MSGDPKTNEWNLLKDQFAALVHDENVGDDSIEKILDYQFHRRLAALINRAVEHNSRTGRNAWRFAKNRVGGR